MSNEFLDTLIFVFVFGSPFIIIGGFVFKAFRAGKLNKGGRGVPVNTLPFYNTNGTPMIPGSSLDVTGSPYGDVHCT